MQPVPEPLAQPAKSSCRVELSLGIRSKICTLHQITLWPFCKISFEFGVPVATGFDICKQPSTPHHLHIGHPRLFITDFG